MSVFRCSVIIGMIEDNEILETWSFKAKYITSIIRDYIDPR